MMAALFSVADGMRSKATAGTFSAINLNVPNSSKANFKFNTFYCVILFKFSAATSYLFSIIRLSIQITYMHLFINLFSVFPLFIMFTKILQ